GGRCLVEPILPRPPLPRISCWKGQAPSSSMPTCRVAMYVTLKLGRTLLLTSRSTLPPSTLPLSDLGLTCVTPSLNSQSPASWAWAGPARLAAHSVAAATVRITDMERSYRTGRREDRRPAG